MIVWTASRRKLVGAVMLHDQRGIRSAVWGNDFTFLRRDLDLKNRVAVMTARRRYEIKVWAILGPESHDDMDARILNWKVRWEANQTL